VVSVVAAFSATCLLTADARAIDRYQVLARAKGFAFHPWTATQANMTASCSGGYQSVYQPGDYLGLPYDWGGYMTKFQFDQEIAQGYGAGSYPADGVLDCTSGLDCSGFVSKAWDAGHWTTSSVHNTSQAISANDVLVGDIFNDAGNHMAMYYYETAAGELVLIESVGYNVHQSMPGWSWVDGYVPRRYDGISGTTATDQLGTASNPIAVNSFPYSDSRDTTQAVSDILDGCGASPGTNESGHEYIYEVVVSSPGTLTVAVQDDAGVDIDVHLYTSMNTSDCVARHDSSLSYSVDCGTYYVVADTYRGSQEYPGPYSLTIDHTPSGAACGNGPPSYDFEGQLGDPCSYPGNEGLGFCNPNLGAMTCIYGSSDSFCSKPCDTVADCGEFPGGCCSPVSSGENYCMIASFCGGGETPGTGDPPPPPGDPDDEELPDGTGGGVDGPAGQGGGDAEDGWTASFQPDSDEAGSACAASGAGSEDRPVAAWLVGLLGFAWLRRRRRR
jgi:MYXO-CTERM domain-containing protein